MKKFEDPLRSIPAVLLQMMRSRAAKWYGALWVVVVVVIALKQAGIV